MPSEGHPLRTPRLLPARSHSDVRMENRWTVGEWKGGKYVQKENILFAEEEKIREGRGGKYLDHENMFFVEDKDKMKIFGRAEVSLKF